MKIVSIITGKIFILIGKMLHKGSSLPGQIALKINKNLFKSFKLPQIVVAVTGSSGKGSISSMIADILRKSGYTVAHNYKGSNLSAGIATLLLENCSLTGKINKQALVYEIDERYTKFVFKDITPQYVVISNICRDQPPRQGHFDLVFEEIKKALKPGMHLILNGDDPYLQKFVLNQNFLVTYYGIHKNSYSYKKNLFENLNLVYCPKCHTKLDYAYYQFENIGFYKCPSCDFKRPKIDYDITKLNYEKQKITINNKYTLHVPSNTLYSIYNTMASFTLASCLNIDINNICTIISNTSNNQKNTSVYKYQKRFVHVLNNKNENASTFNQSLLYTKRFKGKKVIVIGWKEISRRYRFDDLSWLYDIDFEILTGLDIEKVICVGLHAFDIATRMKLAGINEKKIETFSNLDEAKDAIKYKTKGDIFAILNFDYVEPFNMLMEDENDEH